MLLRIRRLIILIAWVDIALVSFYSVHIAVKKKQKLAEELLEGLYSKSQQCHLLVKMCINLTIVDRVAIIYVA